MGQCHENFDWHFFAQKIRPGPHMNGFANFFVFAKIFAKNVCPRSQRLRWHGVNVVNDYADSYTIII